MILLNLFQSIVSDHWITKNIFWCIDYFKWLHWEEISKLKYNLTLIWRRNENHLHNKLIRYNDSVNDEYHNGIVSWWARNSRKISSERFISIIGDIRRTIRQLNDHQWQSIILSNFSFTQLNKYHLDKYICRNWYPAMEWVLTHLFVLHLKQSMQFSHSSIDDQRKYLIEDEWSLNHDNWDCISDKILVQWVFSKLWSALFIVTFVLIHDFPTQNSPWWFNFMNELSVS